MPTCSQHPDVVLEAKKKGWYCEECERTVVTYERCLRSEDSEQHVAPVLNGINITALPSILAPPLHELASETNSVLKLGSMCDAVELSLRFIVATGAAKIILLEGQLPGRAGRGFRGTAPSQSWQRCRFATACRFRLACIASMPSNGWPGRLRVVCTIGLGSPIRLRRCVRARICYDRLPSGARNALTWSATLAISALDDVNLRASPATAAQTQSWNWSVGHYAPPPTRRRC